MTERFPGDAAILLGRCLRHLARGPGTIAGTTAVPIAVMLMFVYVFGGAVRLGADDYVTYDTIRGLFTQQPVGGRIGAALAWCLGILAAAYAAAVSACRRRTA
jgi:hypothetical protein